MSASEAQRTKVFISYCHKDRKWLDRLRVHLRPLERKARIEHWDDTMIKPGSRWLEEIRNAINSAKVAILLVSADFLSSDFIAENELPPLLSAATGEGLVVLPIIISPSRIDQIEMLANFQAVNSPSVPLIKMSKSAQEEVFVKVTKAIENALLGKGARPVLEEDRTSGNRQGAASGPVVISEEMIEEAYQQTGQKVILVTDEPHLGLPFDKIAGIITTATSSEVSHVNIRLVELKIPTVFVDTPFEITGGRKIVINSDERGSVDKLITFTEDFVHTREREYREAVKRNIDSQGGIPRSLIEIVIEDQITEIPREFLAWACRWGPIHEITRSMLPLLGRGHFEEVSTMCETLCSEYQWPVGRQEARRVLPQLAYYCPAETSKLLETWMHSQQLYLVKSAAMSLGNLALMRSPITRAMVEIILNHPNDTVVKEATRALPNVVDVDEDLANYIAEKCASFKSILGVGDYELVVKNYREGFSGIGLSGIPGYLRLSTDLAYERVESAAAIIRSKGIKEPAFLMARNYIFANVLLLAEVDPERLHRTVESLRRFASDRHIQIDLLVAAARLLIADKTEIARYLIEVAESQLDETLRELYGEIKKKLA